MRGFAEVAAMELPDSTNSMISLLCLMQAEERQDRDNHDDQSNQINKTVHFEFSLRKARMMLQLQRDGLR